MPNEYSQEMEEEREEMEEREEKKKKKKKEPEDHPPSKNSPIERTQGEEASKCGVQVDEYGMAVELPNFPALSVGYFGEATMDGIASPTDSVEECGFLNFVDMKTLPVHLQSEEGRVTKKKEE